MPETPVPFSPDEKPTEEELRAAQREDEPQAIVIVLLAAIGFVVSGNMRITDTLLPPMAASFDVTIGDAAVIVSAFGVAFGIFTFLYGGLGDWLGKLKVISCAAAGAAVATYLCSTADTLWAMIIFRFLTGATVAACIPLSMAYIGDNVSFERRPVVLSRYMSGIMLGQIFGMAFGGIITDWLGWENVFRVYGVAMLIVALVLGWFVFSGRVKRRARDRVPFRLANYKDIIARPVPRAFYLMVIFEGALIFGTITFISGLMRARFDLGYGAIGVLLTGYGIGGLVYAACSGAMRRYLNEVQIFLTGGFGMAAGFAIFAFVPSVWPLFLLMGLLGFSFYTFHVVLQTYATELAPKSRGAAMSLFSFSIFFGQSIGAVGVGQIVDGPGFMPAFLTSAILMCVFVAIFARGLVKGTFREA